MSVEREQSDQEDETSSTESITLPAKKVRLMCRYRAGWADEFPWSSTAAGNEFVAECSLCQKVISIANGGRSDLLHHAKTESHMEAVYAVDAAKTSEHFAKTNSATSVQQQVRSQLKTCYITKDYIGTVTE